MCFEVKSFERFNLHELIYGLYGEAKLKFGFLILLIVLSRETGALMGLSTSDKIADHSTFISQISFKIFWAAFKLLVILNHPVFM